MKLADIQSAGLDGEHPDGWLWSAGMKVLTRPQGVSPWEPIEVPADGWQVRKTGLKPWGDAA